MTTLDDAIGQLPRAPLATLPTPLEQGPQLPGGARLWVKRDDLTGLGAGGNKARKLEFLCGAATTLGADTLITVGAAQSNHCRMTAAAGAVLGLSVHLVLGGAAPATATGNQLLSELFGAHLHFAGTSNWTELEAEAANLAERLRARASSPYLIPIGGSTAVGAIGFVAAANELVAQCEALEVHPRAVVFATSSGGTHAGLLAGLGACRAAGRSTPEVIAIGVAPGVIDDAGKAARLARACLTALALDPGWVERDSGVVADFLGPDYAVPTAAGDEAIVHAARTGSWLLDRVYTGKAFGGLLAMARAGRWSAGDDVVFWHTGGLPSLFAPGGLPAIGDGQVAGGL